MTRERTSRQLASALIFSLAIHLIAFFVSLRVASLWSARERPLPDRVRVALVPAPEVAPIPPARAAEPEIQARSPTAPKAREDTGGGASSEDRGREETPPPEPPWGRYRNVIPRTTATSLVALVDAYGEGRLVPDSSYAWMRDPQAAAAELTMQMVNAAFREMIPDIREEMFRREFACNPFLRPPPRGGD